MKTKMISRNDFAQLLIELGLTGWAAEIGVAEGYFSHYLLDRWPGICWQIDPWKVQDTPGYSVHGENDQEARYQRMLARAKDYNGRAQVMRATSEQAAPHFPDASFDFAYIDAIHTYESSSQDIALWWPKVRPGGILAGHDYLEGIFHGQKYGVKAAVFEFATVRRLVIGVTEEPDWPSWWVRKGP